MVPPAQSKPLPEKLNVAPDPVVVSVPAVIVNVPEMVPVQVPEIVLVPENV